MAARKPLRYGKFFIDVERHEVIYDRRKIALAPREFEIAKMLVAAGGCVMSRNSILRGLNTDPRDFNPRAVDTHVARIRSKTAPDSIVTVAHYGYQASRD